MGHPKSFNAVKEYYQETTETLLNQILESYLGIIVKHLKARDFYKECPLVDIEELAKDYVYSLVSSSPEMPEQMDKDSEYFKILPEYVKRDYVAIRGIEIVRNKDLLDKYKVGIGTTNGHFVLNSDGMIQYGQYLICHISLQRAFILMKNNDTESKNIIPVIDLTEETDKINEASFKYELENNKGYVISDSDEILNNLILTTIEQH